MKARSRLWQLTERQVNETGIRLQPIEILFAQIRFVSGQEHATYLKTLFDRQVDQELLRIDDSDTEI